MTNNKYIKKYCISINKKIIDVLNFFEKNKSHIVLVVDNKKKFLGIITSTDLRRATLRGYDNKSEIKKIVNYKPLYLKDKVDDNQISNITSSSMFNKIDPPLIPIINKSGVPYKILNKNHLNLNFLVNQNSKQKPRILLIGGAGYIGSVLAKKLLLHNYSVTIFDKFIYSSKLSMKKKLPFKNLTLVKGDSRRINEVFFVIKKNDIVVHLAELVGDPLCEKRPAKTYEINFLASMSISNICKNLPISKFIYISSCSVYGSNVDNKLLTETSKIFPLSVYAKLKALSEKTIIRNLGEYCKPCILRLGTVFGESPRPRFDLVLNLFSSMIANKKSIVVKGGNQWRPFIHVEDVSNAIMKIIKLDKSKTSGQIFNLASYNYKISEIVQIIKKIYPKTKIDFEKNFRDQRNYKISSAKAKKIINFSPKITLKRGIINLVNFVKKNKIRKINTIKYLNILNSDKF